MYKFFAIAFYSLPIVFVGLYAINSTFFFDRIFLYLSLIGLILYVGFAVYIVGQTFLTIRDDSLLHKFVLRITKLKKLGFMKVGHVTNAIAFIWVTLLTTIMFSLFFFLVSYVTVKFFGAQLQGLIRYSLEYPTRDNQIIADINDLERNMNFLIKARSGDKADLFFNNNEKEYTDSDPDYEYKISYSEDTINPPQLNPHYNYYLTICFGENETAHCNKSQHKDSNAAVFAFSQNEIIEEIHGDVFDFEASSESLHRVRVITNLRTVDLMVAFSKTATVFPDNSTIFFGDNYEDSSELFEFVRSEGPTKIFNYEKYKGEKLEYNLSKTFYYDSVAGKIKGSF